MLRSDAASADGQQLEPQELIRHVFDTVQAALLVTDNDENIVLANETAAAMLGYTLDELKAVKPAALIHPDELAVIDQRAEARREGIPSSPRFRRRMVRKDGSSLWVEATPTALEIDGGIRGRVVEYRDITGLVEAERVIRERDERLALMFEHSQAGMVFVDGDGRALMVNHRFGEMLGYTTEELMEIVPLMSLVHPDDQPPVAEGARELRAAGSRRLGNEGTVRLIAQDGSVVFTEMHGRMTPMADGSQAFFAEIWDVTARVAATDALRKSEMRLKQASQMARLGWWEWHPDNEENRIVWTAEMYTLFGLEPGSVDPTKAYEAGMHPDDRRHERHHVLQAWERGEPYESQHRIVLPDGSERLIHRLAQLVRGDKGEPTYLVGTIQDITEHAGIERALAEREVQYQATVTALAEALVVYDSKGASTDADQASVPAAPRGDDETRMAQEGDPDAAIGRTDRSAIDLPSLARVGTVARETETDLDNLPMQMLASSVIIHLDVLRTWAESGGVDDLVGRAALGSLWALANGFLKIDGLDLLGEEILEMLERSGILGQAE